MLSSSNLYLRFSRTVVVVVTCMLSGKDAGVMARGHGSPERPPQLQCHHVSFCCCAATSVPEPQSADLVAIGLQLTSCCNLHYEYIVMGAWSRSLVSPYLALPWQVLLHLFLGVKLVSNVTT